MNPGSRRFQRKHRLSDSTEFDAVFKAGRRSRDAQFVVLAARNNKSHPRLGLALSRKTVRGAVARNKVKRMARESFRHHAKALSGLDIVIMPQKKIALAAGKSGKATTPAKWDDWLKQPGAGKSMSRSLQGHWQRIMLCKD